MPHPIEASILRILNSNGETVGTGFLVAPNLVVSCAHVILEAGQTVDSMAGKTISVQFTAQEKQIEALILPEFWRDIDQEDIAILQILEVPDGVFPLRLERASTCKLKAPLYTFGYSQAADEDRLGGSGEFITWPKGSKVFQFRMHQADRGHSGAPVLDVGRGAVIGILQKGKTEPGRNDETTFAIPVEIIWQICPPLKPPRIMLPRAHPLVEGINLLPYDYDQHIQNFLTEYLGSVQHPVPFGGREATLQVLDEWLEKSSTSYLLLAAPAGRGKSALLVRWLESLIEHKDLALAFVPISIRFSTNMERVFYISLAARLAFLHGENIPTGPDTSTAAYRGLVSDYLSKPLAGGRTLLVVLDGLDEASDWQAGADFLPRELPTGVRVVVSARFLAGDVDSIPWLRRLNWEQKGLAFAPLLTQLDRAGLADVLLKMGCPLDDLSRNVNIVDELYRLSEGDPLLVNLYVGDLWVKGEDVTHLKPEDLISIRPGYQGYFDRWWDDQKKLWGQEKPWLERHVRTVRNLLSGALDALYLSDLYELAGNLESDYIADALDVLKRFVIGDNRVQGYTFSHPKLGQYFWENLLVAEQALIEERFLLWCERTLQILINGLHKSTDHIPQYVVRNYGAHLGRAKLPVEKWLPLINHQQWAQAWFVVEGAYSGYLQDVQRVWEQLKLADRSALAEGIQAPYIGKQIRCGLIEASLHSLAGKIPAELVWPLVRDSVWTWAQGWVAIRQMPDPVKQAASIRSLLSHLSGEQFLDALLVARSIQDDDVRCEILIYIVPYMPIQYLEKVIATAHARRDSRNYAKLLSALALRLPELSVEALESAHKINNDGELAGVLNNLADQLPKGKLVDLLKVAHQIATEETLVELLSDLASRLPKDELVLVLKEAQQLTEEANRALVLHLLAQRLPRLGGEALTAWQQIWGDENRAGMLSRLAQRLPQEKLQEVLKKTQSLNRESCRVPVLRILAQRLPEEELKHVRNAAYSLKQEEDRIAVLQIVAERLPELSDESLKAVFVIGHEQKHASDLLDLAKRLPPEELRHVWNEARALDDEPKLVAVMSVLALRSPEEELGPLLAGARKLVDDRLRIQILCLLAQRLPDVTEEALQAVSTVRDPWTDAKMLTAFAQFLPMGKLEQLLWAIQTVSDERVRANILVILAQRLPQTQVKQLVKITSTIQADVYYASVLSQIAQRCPEVRNVALAAARAIQDDGMRSRLLVELAQQMPELLEEALMAAHQILDRAYRTRKLYELLQNTSTEQQGKILNLVKAIKQQWYRQELLQILAAQMPPEKLGKLLRAALPIENEEERTNLLRILAGRMPTEKLRKILKAVRTISNEEARVEVLGVIAHRWPEVAEEAFLVARKIRVEENQALALRSLVKQLPEAIEKALEPAEAIQNERERADLFAFLSEHLPEQKLTRVADAAERIKNIRDRVIVLCALSQRQPNEMSRVLNLIRTIPDEGDRAEVLSILAGQVPQQELGKILELGRELRHDTARIRVLSEIAHRLPEVCAEVLKIIQTLQNEDDQARFLVPLIEKLPINRIGLVLQAAQNLQDEEIRVDTIIALAQRQATLISVAVKAAQTLWDERACARVLKKLVQGRAESANRVLHETRILRDSTMRAEVFMELVNVMCTISPTDCYSSIEVALPDMAARTRSDLFSDISVLMPVLVYLGTEDTPSEIYHAARDVTTWWP